MKAKAKAMTAKVTKTLKSVFKSAVDWFTNRALRDELITLKERINILESGDFFDVSDVARKISLSELAEEFDPCDIADRIDGYDIAEHVPTDDLARAIAEDISASDVAEEIDIGAVVRTLDYTRLVKAMGENNTEFSLESDVKRRILS
jgi:hypothetical protein